jgi:hypothetical protein
MPRQTLEHLSGIACFWDAEETPRVVKGAGNKQYRADFFWILFFAYAKKSIQPASAGTGIRLTVAIATH